jgi:hypothetical protein
VHIIVLAGEHGHILWGHQKGLLKSVLVKQLFLLLKGDFKQLNFFRK